MAQTRLDKYLSDAGIGTRSQVKQYIKKKLVTVNGSTATSGDRKIDPDSDQICYQGTPVVRARYVYYLLNKPAGYISATEDAASATVLDLIHDPTHSDLFPVGRLDKDTEGLLLITNDGSLSHQLLSPKKHVDKTYYVELDAPIPEDAVDRCLHGIDIGDEKPTLPAQLELLTPEHAYLTIQEGRYHQVKRMFHTLGCEVTYLKRIRMGSLTLDSDLPSGNYRPLTTEEVAALHRINALTH